MNNYFLQLKKDIPNDIGWIRRILSYAFDWYIGGMIASLPVIVIYMMLHQDATYIPQNLSSFMHLTISLLEVYHLLLLVDIMF